jgi:hypothetical protein
MNLTQDQIDRLEAALEKLEELDPAQIPEPAAELANLLAIILEETESS